MPGATTLFGLWCASVAWSILIQMLSLPVIRFNLINCLTNDLCYATCVHMRGSNENYFRIWKKLLVSQPAAGLYLALQHIAMHCRKNDLHKLSLLPNLITRCHTCRHCYTRNASAFALLTPYVDALIGKATIVIFAMTDWRASESYWTLVFSCHM